MASIKEKLNYMNDIKILLKKNINKINNVLTDDSTFRSYPQELFNGYLDILNNGTDVLWSNLEKVSQTGTEPVLEGVETAPIKMVLNGNTTQETTTGKNLFPIDNIDLTLGDVKVYTQNGVFIVNGTATSNIYETSPSWQNNFSFNLKAGIYTFSLNLNEPHQITLRNKTTGDVLARVNGGTILNVTFTLEEDTEVYLGFYFTKDTTYDNLQYKIQLEQGSTATSWEKYTGGQLSPSPDYPQQVKVVKGENVVSVSGKNLASSVEYANPTQRFYRVIGATYSVVEGKKYAVSFDTQNTGVVVYHQGANTIKLALTPYNVTCDGTRQTFIGTATETGTFSVPSIVARASVDSDIETGLCSNFMIEEIPSDSSTATPYVPYSKTDYPINLGTLELCKIGDYQDYLYKNNGKWYVYKEIGEVVLDGNESWLRSYDDEYVRFYFTLENILNLGTGRHTNILICSHFNSSAISNYGICFAYTKQAFFYSTKDIKEISLWKTWLSNNNVTLYYVLATPTETEITNTTLIEQLEAISKAKSVKDKTYITQTNEELPFIINANAILKNNN